MNHKKVVCIGNITEDKLLFVDDIPELDDVAYINGNAWCMGGRGAIVALILGRAKVDINLITVVPQIQKAKEYLNLLYINGVNIEGVDMTTTGEHMHEVTIAISKKQQNCISFFRPTFIPFLVTKKQKEIIQRADIAYFSTHKKSFNKELLLEIDEETCCIIHNVSGYFLRDEEYFKLMLAKSKVLIFNEEEGMEMKNKLKIDRYEELFSLAPYLEALFATSGEKGSVIYSRDKRMIIKPHLCNAICPVGAGDAYAAGITYGLSNEWNLERCAEFASELASISVASETSYPDLNAVDRLVQKYEDN